MKIDNVDLLKLLKKLEWSSVGYGQPTYMGSNDGREYPTCPYCFNFKPKAGEECEFGKSEIGHKNSCKLNKYIKLLSK